MKYIEINENYSPEDDEFNSIDLEDTRKTRLTLAHLSKLRKIREYRKFQKASEDAQVKKQYGTSEESSGDSAGALDL
jgi:16S rRNA C1402 (ribose-2'-O) methylase RsmI